MLAGSATIIQDKVAYIGSTYTCSKILLPDPQLGSKWRMSVAFCYLATMNFEPWLGQMVSISKYRGTTRYRYQTLKSIEASTDDRTVHL